MPRVGRAPVKNLLNQGTFNDDLLRVASVGGVMQARIAAGGPPGANMKLLYAMAASATFTIFALTSAHAGPHAGGSHASHPGHPIGSWTGNHSHIR